MQAVVTWASPSLMDQLKSSPVLLVQLQPVVRMSD